MLISLRMEWDRVEDRAAYPYNLPAIAQIDELDLDAPIVIFVGANGSGKSTLMEAIAVHLGCNPEGGSPNFNFDTAKTLSSLHQASRLARRIRRNAPRFFYRADAYHVFATEMRRLDENEDEDGPLGANSPPVKMFYGGQDLHEMSHGQAVIRLLRNRFRGGGIYLMDEPEAALAPETQLEVIARIAELVRKGARFVLATHSPLLMALPGALIYELSDEGIARKSYAELNHVRLYKRFLGDPESMVARLTAPEEPELFDD
ncbi:AAA family ATPase [Hansschlegelia quercus]|uniref:ATP-binding cassette domain-containing protein n=1 Tax=Hansschlegelia quercus TaxID=2528245 RepID=A0A4Q9GBB1_9HYPH|nr:AAA family ATPase [Hansschlegelia quercus]TBN48281.1 ATP-binding cassette domain-containing protein [Hansschlegelia quercus]